MTDIQPHYQSTKPWRRTLRLRFRATDGKVRLESLERLDMMCPPALGEPPQAGRHGGYWLELHDAHGHIIFHRLLNFPLGNSVEVHSPEGKIERIFGAPVENTFEVLVPDDPSGKSVVLMGEPLDPKTGHVREGGAKELARFDIEDGSTGDPSQKRGA